MQPLSPVGLRGNGPARGRLRVRENHGHRAARHIRLLHHTSGRNRAGDVGDGAGAFGGLPRALFLSRTAQGCRLAVEHLAQRGGGRIDINAEGREVAPRGARLAPEKRAASKTVFRRLRIYSTPQAGGAGNANTPPPAHAS